MRTTAPALRRRTYAQKLSTERWLARRQAQRGNDTDTDGLDTDGSDDDDFPQQRTTTRRRVTRRLLRTRDEGHDGDDGDDGDEHSGDASGEDGLDSGNDTDDDIRASVTRPAPAATQRPSPARLPGAGVAPIGAGTGGTGAGLAAPPRATPSLATPSRAASSRVAVPVATNAVPLGSGVGSGLGVVYLPPSNVAATPPGTGAAAGASGAAGLPSSTLGAAEDEEITSASDSDGIESGNPSDSDSEDSASENEANKSSSVTSSPPTATAAPALGGSAGSSALIGTSSAGPVTAITPTPADFFVTAPRSSALAAPVPTGVAGASPNGGDLPTLALPESSPQPTPPTSLGELQGGGSTTNGAVTAEQSRPNAGAAAGIVIGVLAAIGILIGAAFVWRKWRADGKAMPQLPLFWRKSGNDDYPEDIKRDFDPDMIPILPPPTYQQPKKTNSEMMDGLMQATFKAENGDRSTQGTFPNISNQAVASDAGSQRAMDNVGPGFVQQAARGPGFMDEAAYTALAGPPTPAPTKPVQRWLEDVKTPRSSVGGVRWPVSAVPEMPTMQVPFRAEDVPVGKPRDDQFLPPQPAYAANNRYTTTTATSSSTEDFWFK